MAQNCTFAVPHVYSTLADRSTVPFVVTIVVSLLFSVYMLVDPGIWLTDFMKLTEMSMNFKVFILILALGGFTCAWIAERHAFLWIAGLLGQAHDRIWPQRKKKRKEYKLLLEGMRI